MSLVNVLAHSQEKKIYGDVLFKNVVTNLTKMYVC